MCTQSTVAMVRFQGFPSHSSHCSGGLFPQYSGVSPISVFQDKFDHDKGQKSAISGRRLHWRLSTGFFCFFSSIYVQFSKTSPLKSGESSEKSVEKIASNPVTSVAVMVQRSGKF